VAKDIRGPVLIVRGELDFWSRPADLSALARDLVSSPKVKTLVIRGGTDYLLLDSSEHGRSQFISEVLNFLM
jgi:pimeloyl-ACP methyl ester carboxylesterase